MSLNDFSGNDFIGLMPCPLQVPFEQIFGAFNEKHYQKTGARLSGLVVSNANNQLNFFERLSDVSDIDEFPSILMAPGFNHFFHRDFMQTFKDQFAAIGPLECNAELKIDGLQDPQRNYYIPCFNPTVWVVDRTVHRDLPNPRRWGDLLEPEFEGLVALRGHQDGNFCEGTLLNVYHEYGTSGVEQLGKAVKCGLHPSQMVKLAGSGKKEAPAISAVPYFFSKMVRENEFVSIVWPEDGAIVNPFVMLIKKSSLPKMEALSEFVTGEQMGRIFAECYFPSPHPGVSNKLPSEACFKWPGWDFIQNNDLGQLVPEIQRIFMKNYVGSQSNENNHGGRSAFLGQNGCHSENRPGHSGRGAAGGVQSGQLSSDDSRHIGTS
jgi:ABC-type Fe3+ transport system substrate-binding protein